MDVLTLGLAKVDAGKKADAARLAAISTASADATSKANLAQGSASADATSKADEAIRLAAVDASQKVSNEAARADETFSTPASVAAQIVSKADLVDGLIPTAQLPSLALSNVVTVGSQAETVALTAAQVQQGDIAVRTDGAGTFILTDDDPSIFANWTLLNSPADTVSSVNGQVGTIVLGKADIGLPLADNTSDANKPVSFLQAAATVDAINNFANPALGVTYNPDGSLATTTENGETTTYFYNVAGFISSAQRAGVTRTYTYDVSGNITGAA
jgi:YD repeat-containing protein